METPAHLLVCLAGLLTVILTLSLALSTFVLPRAARSQLNRVVFGLLIGLILVTLLIAYLPPLMIFKKHKLLPKAENT